MKGEIVNNTSAAILPGSIANKNQPLPLGALPALLTVSNTAALLGISRASAYRYAAAGELPTRRFGGRASVITAQLSAMLDARAS